VIPNQVLFGSPSYQKSNHNLYVRLQVGAIDENLFAAPDHPAHGSGDREVGSWPGTNAEFHP